MSLLLTNRILQTDRSWPVDIQNGQAAAGTGKAVGRAALCLTAALIHGWPSGYPDL